MSNSSPVELNMPPQKQSGSMGALAGTLVIVIILLLGGLYLWGAWLNKNEPGTLPYIPNEPNAAQ